MNCSLPKISTVLDKEDIKIYNTPEESQCKKEFEFSIICITMLEMLNFVAKGM
jgi:hypothetical protein